MKRMKKLGVLFIAALVLTTVCIPFSKVYADNDPLTVESTSLEVKKNGS